MKKILAKASECSDNGFTTELKAVKPNRHSMAIFMSNTLKKVLSAGINTVLFLNRLKGRIKRNNGLIGVNTRPILGNSPSRLLAVVESRYQFYIGNKQTKLKGA